MRKPAFPQARAAEFYASAGAIADEAIRMIRTVIAFDTQEHEAKRYSKELASSMAQGTRAGMFQGLGMGMTFVRAGAGYMVGW